MIIWYFHPYGNAPGRGKYLRPYFLAKEWQAMGHGVTCFVSRNHHLLDKEEPLPADETIDGVRFIALAARPYSGNGLSRALNMVDFCRSMLGPVNAPKPDVVICSSPHPFSIFPAALLARRHKAKLVFEVRDIWPLSIIEMTDAPRWHPITIGAWIAERFAYRKSNLVASLLGNAESYMRGRGMRGRFVHVPNGISPGESLATPPITSHGKQAAAAIARWHVDGRTVIIHPGTQGSPSALDVLLKAVALLKGGKKVGVLLVGGGDHERKLPVLAEELNLQDVVEFVPPVPKSEALWLTAHSDIGYAGKRNFQTVFQHGISFNKISDYMQVGLPIVLPITTVGDPVTASGCGVVTGDEPVAIAAGLETLLSMPAEKRSALGEKGKRYASERLAYTAIAKDYISAIAQS